VLDHDVAGALVAVAQGQLAQRGRLRVIADDVLLEDVARLLPAAVVEVLTRIALQQEFEDALAAVVGGRRFGGHHHAVLGRDIAGRLQLVLTLDRHQADAAVGHDGQLRIPAQRRDIDAGRARCVQDGGPWREVDARAVDGQCGHTRSSSVGWE
jgi:hypothetical protein